MDNLWIIYEYAWWLRKNHRVSMMNHQIFYGYDMDIHMVSIWILSGQTSDVIGG